MDKSSLWAELGIFLNICTWFKLPAYLDTVFIRPVCDCSTGVLLGVRQQSRSPLCMDIQAVSASSAQLPHGVCDNSVGNVEAVSVGLFPCRE